MTLLREYMTSVDKYCDSVLGGALYGGEPGGDCVCVDDDCAAWYCY